MIKKDILILSSAFFMIFFGFNTAQQYFAAVYSDFGLAQTATMSLALVYTISLVGFFLSPLIISHLGSKKTMAIASIGYVIFIAMIPTKNNIYILAASILCGLSASLLWTAQGNYIINKSSEKEKGKNIGFFYTMLNLGSLAGIIIAAKMYELFELNLFYMLAILIMGGALTLIFLPHHEDKKEKFDLFSIIRMFKTNASLYFPILFTTLLALGFFFGTIAIELKKIYGLGTFGVISSIFWLSLVIGPIGAGMLAHQIDNKILLKLLAVFAILGGLLLSLGNLISTIIGSVLIGLFNGGAMTIGMSLVSEMSPDKKQTAAYFMTATTLGMIAALSISNFATYIQSVQLIIISGIISIIALMFIK